MKHTKTLVVGVAAIAALAGSTLSMAQSSVTVIANSGTNVGVLPTGVADTAFAAFDHFSAAPCGKMVVVGRISGAGLGQGGNQGVWVYDGSAWSLRVRAGVTALSGVPNTLVSQVISSPVLNDAGDVMFVANLTGAAGGTGLIRANADGQARLVLRFNAGTGAGSVPGIPTGIPYMGSSDSYRFSNAGPLYNSQRTGLLGPSGVGDQLVARTFITLQNGNTLPPGLAVAVSSAQPNIGMTNSGFSAQRVGSSGYGVDNQLSGFLLFDQWGTATFTVRDGATPIESMPGQVVTSSSLSTSGAIAPVDPQARSGMNSSGTIAFAGRFGNPPVNTGNVGGQPPFTLVGVPAIFIKAPNGMARMVASLNMSAPGLANTRFAAFGTPVLNAVGQVAFSATLTTPDGNRASIWTTDPSGQLRLVALVGASAGPGSAPRLVPGLASAYSQFTSDPSINRQGQVVFNARINSPLVEGGASVVSDTICAFTSSVGPAVLIRSGQVINLPGLGAQSVSLTSNVELGGRIVLPTGNDDGQPTLLTDDGRAIIRAVVSGAGPSLLTVGIDLPTGACCSGATCRVLAESACISSGKTIFQGHASTCVQPGQPGACCIGDFDHNGTIMVQDLFDFIDAWISGDFGADADQNGVTQVQDLFEFLSSFASGC